METRFAARLTISERRRLSLVTVAFREATSKMPHWVAGIIGVVSIEFTRQLDVSSMVNVVVPLRVVRSWMVVRVAPQVASGIVVVFQHQMDQPLAPNRIPGRFR